MPFPRTFTTTPFERSSSGRFGVSSCKPTPGGLLPSSVQFRKSPCVRDTPHTRIFSRSPRRDLKMKRWPLSGSCPMTVWTRSASRSKPQRMSAASAASQIRAPCARSSARRLGSAVNPAPPTPPPRHVNAPLRNPAPQTPAGRSPAGSRSRNSAVGIDAPPPPQRALPQTAPLSLGAAVSSRYKTAIPSDDAPGRTPPRSARCPPAPPTTHSNAPTLHACVHA